jgi:HEPN domain-containing protein
MNIEEHIQYWSKGAEEDLQVAEDLFKQNHFVWSLFIGHLVLEKDLKAVYVQVKGQTPPRTHNLLLLAEAAGVSLDSNREEFFSVANDFNIEARYPDVKEKFRKRCTREFTLEMLERIKEGHQWLKSLIIH